ncbi:MAG: hypothetical protein K1X66_00680 [Verrucomicrobiae bacterium]|nr:hypothetical protein [Verrucomicrobiae bacterium]
MRIWLGILLATWVASSVLAQEERELSFSDLRKMPEVAPSGGFSFGKIAEYVNDPEVTPVSDDKSLRFERRYHNFGAVTQAQRRAKRGHYFYVNWHTKERVSNVKVRLEYRQKNTKDKLYFLEVPFSDAKGWQKAVFEIVGEAYFTQGVVTSWRALIMQGDQIMAERRSFIW